jgi:hypothetical protein
LWPLPHSKAPRADDFGLVLDFETKSGSCLLMSDSGMAVEEMIAPNLRSGYSVLVQGDNGDSNLLGKEFLEFTKPKVLVLTVPHDVERESKPDLFQILTTAKNGGISLWLNSTGVRSQTYLQEVP